MTGTDPLWLCFYILWALRVLNNVESVKYNQTWTHSQISESEMSSSCSKLIWYQQIWTGFCLLNVWYSLECFWKVITNQNIIICVCTPYKFNLLLPDLQLIKAPLTELRTITFPIINCLQGALNVYWWKHNEAFMWLSIYTPGSFCRQTLENLLRELKD